MKASINAWSVPGNVGFRDMFNQIHRAGFDGIELNVDAPGASEHCLSLETSDDELLRIKALSDEFSLPVVSISSSQHGASNMGSDEPDVRARSKDLIRKQIHCAKILGADGILVVPGGMNAHVTLAQAHLNSRHTLLEMKEEIEEAKIKVGVENVWNGFFMSPFDMVSFIDDIGSAFVGAYFDVGNVAVFSEPEEWIRILGKRIVKVHVKDWKRTNGRFTGTWANLMEGSIDWKAVMKAFSEVGYDDCLTAELGAMPQYPDFLYDITSKALRLIIG